MKRKIEKIWHPWDTWECYKAGFFGPYPKNMTKALGEKLYADFFKTPDLFEKSLNMVLEKWHYSCEHNLTSPSLNKIAWGGQAACCYAWGVPAECRAGFRFLTPQEQETANLLSEALIRNWYERRNYEQPENL
jgi:hypothetical protein